MSKVQYLSNEAAMSGGFLWVSNEIRGAEGLRVNRSGVVLGKIGNRILTRRFSKGGYYTVTVSGRQVPLGQILCATFHGPKPDVKNACVIFLDGPLSSEASRVRWGTRKESRAYGKARAERIKARVDRIAFERAKARGDE